MPYHTQSEGGRFGWLKVKNTFRNTVKIGARFGFEEVKHVAGHENNGKCETKACTLSVVCGARGIRRL